MKEFQTKAGGRYLFNEDFENLQDLILSSHSIFKDCGGNFVIYGLGYNSTSHKFGAGLVWLAGKLRSIISQRSYLAPLFLERKRINEIKLNCKSEIQKIPLD